MEECYEKLGPVTGTKRGLLVNPHAEVDLRIGKSIAWSAVEAFLSAPAQALGSAA
jgi:hypothetical protein